MVKHFIYIIIGKKIFFIFLILFSFTRIYSQCVTYTLKVCIEGHDKIHIKGTLMWWEHLTLDPPGQHSDCSTLGAGILVNGNSWNIWNVPFTILNTNCYSLSVNVIQCNNICNLLQSPDATNGWETIYEFNDEASTGPHIYELSFTFCPATIVNPIPDQSVCNGQSVTLTATGASSYIWNTGETTSGITVFPVSTTSYTVTGTSGVCSSTISTTVTVGPLVYNIGEPYHFDIPDNGLAAFYPFNGNANDESGNGNNGTVNGATLIEDRCGNINSAYSFNGVSNYIEAPTSSSLSIQNSITMAAWIKTNDPDINTPPQASMIVAKHNTMYSRSYSVYVTDQSSNSDSIRLQLFEPNNTEYGACIHSTYYDNNWHLITSTYDYTSGNVKIFGDCQLRKSVNIGQINLMQTSVPFTIGCYMLPSSPYHRGFFHGGIDDVLLYNRALSDDEILALYLECKSLSVNVAPDTICQNQFTEVNIVNSQPGISYQLLINGISVGSPQIGSCDTLHFNTGLLSATANATISATDPISGCSLLLDTTLIIIVNPLPLAEAGADQTICQGSSITLSATGGITYQWNNGVIQNIPFTPSTTTTYTVTVTNSNGCTATDNVTITTGNILSVSITASQNPINMGASTYLTATGATNYLWNGGLGTSNPLTVSPTSTTTYTVTGTSSGCTGTASITITVNQVCSLPPPDLRCASVTTNGDVWLTWIPPVDSMNIYKSFYIYSSTSSSGPFNLIDSVFGIGQNSYTNHGANANIQSMYYYVKTQFNCNGYYYSVPSDTLHTILLNVVNSGNGTALLTWNSIHSPNLPTSMGWYHIYREYPPSILNLVDSTQSLSFVDTITFCNAFINYFVDIQDSSGCLSLSSVDGNLFQDISAPVKPVVDSVSVDSLSGNSVIGWTASPSGDVQGYVIYENINLVWVAIDTVWGGSATYYNNNKTLWANPDSSSLSYCVAAFDSCLNTSPLSINQNTIFLTSKLDICGGGVTLNWTPYVNMNPNLNGYRIYVKENNGPLTLLATNPSTDLFYTHSPLTQNSIYIYSIQAFDNTGHVTSTSNQDTVIAYNPMQPQFVYLRYVTVRNNDHVELKALIDTSGYVSKCRIMRADTISGPFVYIGSVNIPHFSNTITFNDLNAEVNKKSYYYKVIVVDSCGNDAITSNIGRTIFLKAEPENDLENNLVWNKYENWFGYVNTYNIYRKVDDVFAPNSIASLTYVNTSYSDDISDLLETDGKFEYIVEAIEGNGNPYLFVDTSYSNTAHANQPSKLYIPNAFVPNGLNNIFLPIKVFVDAKDYDFTIYNRWGMMIFQTNDKKTGWDGTYKGEAVQQGVYVYLVKFKDSENRYVERRGTVTLLR